MICVGVQWGKPLHEFYSHHSQQISHCSRGVDECSVTDNTGSEQFRVPCAMRVGVASSTSFPLAAVLTNVLAALSFLSSSPSCVPAAHSSNSCQEILQSHVVYQSVFSLDAVPPPNKQLWCFFSCFSPPEMILAFCRPSRRHILFLNEKRGVTASDISSRI